MFTFAWVCAMVITFFPQFTWVVLLVLLAFYIAVGLVCLSERE